MTKFIFCSFAECYRFCNTELDCVAFTELNDQCYVCNNVTNAGAEIACELTERMVVWLNHVMELPDFG